MAINWTIARKLAGLSCIGAVLIVVIATMGLRSVSRLHAAIGEVHETGQAVRAHMRADMMHDALRSDVLAALLAARDKDLSQKDGIAADIADHAQTFRDALEENSKRITDKALKAKIEELMPDLRAYIALAEEINGLAFTDVDAANAKLPGFVAQFSRLEPLMEGVSEAIEETSEQATKASDATVESARFAMIGAGIVALVALLVVAARISASILGPLRQSLDITTRIADGELDHDIVVRGSDETAQILEALKRMSGTIAGVVAQVRAAAESVSTSSREVAGGTMDLSQRIEQQAASLEETSSTANQISSTVANNASMAGQAGKIAGDAAKRTADSRTVVGRSAEAMEEISKSSRRIAEIIGTIDSIAFQTNLLALNAAVEAARAGEQGRGFAVVATEVRNLAQRCASAAREIKELIAESVDKVRQGTQLVQESGDALVGTETAVSQLSGLVREVADASHEQASGVDQINRAVSHMDGMTQQNAALVEQLAAASSSMEQQARDLLHAVGFFKTGATAGAQDGNRQAPRVTPGSQGGTRLPSSGRARGQVPLLSS